MVFLLWLYAFCWDYVFISRSCRREIYKRDLRPLIKVRCFWILKTETELLFSMLSLTWLSECDQQVEPPLSQRSVVLVHQEDTNQKRSSLSSPTKVNRQEQLAPTVGPDKTLSHPHLWLSLLTWWGTQEKTRRDLKETMPRLTATHGHHDGSSRGEWGAQTRVRVDPRISQGRAGEATSGSPSWARTSTGFSIGRNRCLLDRYGGARANEWGVVQNQWGVTQEPTPTG